MSENLFLITISLPLATILLVFGMRYYAAVEQAKARLANDDAYRQIAAKAATAESDNTIALSTIQSTLSDVRARLGAIEKVLKDVG